MKQERIAIFSNNDEFVLELTDYLNSVEGFTVCASSSNGNTATELIKHNSPTVAVVDLVLTGLDGFGVLDFVKENCADCLTIAVGGFVDDKIVDQAIEHGAVYYLAKPVKVETLADRITELQSGRTVNYKVATEIRDKRRAGSLDEKISNIFITIGIPPHKIGRAHV